MTWTTAGSPAQDWDLERAWSRANPASAAAGVPIKIQLRVTACVCDLLAAAALSRDLFALETARSRNHSTAADSLSIAERHHDMVQFSAERWANIYRLTAAVKSVFLFARSFHDAAHGMMLYAV